VVGLNLKGIFRALKAFVPGMVKRGKGSVIVFSSIRAQVVEPGQGIYAATKAGTVQMIRALAAEIGRSGVRANAIAPGVV
jgi:NAD(P)-dependent dehydrogenase (short-subunit alcohol dehydrogenase family)